MGRWTKFRLRLLSGRSDRNITFADLAGYLRHLGFEQRLRGDHHIYTVDHLPEILNLQPRADGAAKPYQVRQVRDIVLRYELGTDDDEV